MEVDGPSNGVEAAVAVAVAVAVALVVARGSLEDAVGEGLVGRLGRMEVEVGVGAAKGLKLVCSSSSDAVARMVLLS